MTNVNGFRKNQPNGAVNVFNRNRLICPLVLAVKLPVNLFFTLKGHLGCAENCNQV